MVRRRVRGLAVLMMAAVLGVVAPPAVRGEPVPPLPPVTVADLPDAAAASRSAVDPVRRIETYRSSRPVAPGVELSSFDWYEPGDAGGWVRADTLGPRHWLLERPGRL